MQISEIHSLALQLLNSDSSDYDTAKLMSYTNDGIFYINNLRVAAKDPDVIKQLTVNGITPKPSDFGGFMPPNSAYPLLTNGKNIELAYGAPPSVVMKYSVKQPFMTSASDTFPLPDECAGMVAQFIKIQLELDNSMDVASDWAILDRQTTAYIKAKGG